MKRISALLGRAAAGMAAVPARARPPEGALPLSQIVAQVEATDDFAYIEDVDWDGDGHWDVEFRTTDGEEREVEIDPLTGEIR